MNSKDIVYEPIYRSIDPSDPEYISEEDYELGPSIMQPGPAPDYEAGECTYGSWTFINRGCKKCDNHPTKCEKFRRMKTIYGRG